MENIGFCWCSHFDVILFSMLLRLPSCNDNYSFIYILYFQELTSVLCEVSLKIKLRSRFPMEIESQITYWRNFCWITIKVNMAIAIYLTTAFTRSWLNIQKTCHALWFCGPHHIQRKIDGLSCTPDRYLVMRTMPWEKYELFINSSSTSSVRKYDRQSDDPLLHAAQRH